MAIKNHYGVYVDSDVPTTGVLSNRDILYLQDAMYYEDGVNLTWEEHCSEYHKDGKCSASDLSVEECNEFWEEQADTYLIGDWRKDENGQYEPVEDGKRGYAAIVREFYTQVVWSKHTVKCALCSPCYPGQGDIGSKGEFTAYTMPPEYMGAD